MKIDGALFDLFRDRAGEVTVERLCMGVGYTAVATSDGGIGVAYTWLDKKGGCSVLSMARNPEGAPAIGLLELILEDDPLGRTVALAAVNALNHRYVCDLPKAENDELLDRLGVEEGARVAMVGAFAPVIASLRDRGAVVEVWDTGKGIGDRRRFFDMVGGWADILVVTSTTIINNTTEEILGHAKPGARSVLLGPSTPLVAEAFSHLPVDLLAGTVPIDREGVLRCVRHGAGTPAIQRYSKKVILEVGQRPGC